MTFYVKAVQNVTSDAAVTWAFFLCILQQLRLDCKPTEQAQTQQTQVLWVAHIGEKI